MKQKLEMVWGICAILFGILGFIMLISFEVEDILLYLGCVAILAFGIFNIFIHRKKKQ